MSLRKINKFDSLGIKCSNFPAAHFASYTLPKYSESLKIKIVKWCEENLHSRFYVGKTIMLDSSRTIIYGTEIRCESVHELTYFILSFN